MNTDKELVELLNLKEASIEDLSTRIKEALELLISYGGIDGSHHKDWCMDEMSKILAGKSYESMVAYACDGEDGPSTYHWFEDACPP